MEPKNVEFDKDIYKFFLINSLAHDFVHDFNPTGMIDRMNKMRAYISALQTKITDHIGSIGGGTSSNNNNNNNIDKFIKLKIGKNIPTTWIN